MWSKEPLTIEQRKSGLWHVARIMVEGTLLTRTTVLPQNEKGTESTRLNGAVGQSRMMIELLQTAARDDTLSAKSRAECAGKAAATKDWLDQFPDQENPKQELEHAIAIEESGRIVTPYFRKHSERSPSLATAGRITNFRTKKNRRRKVPAVFEGWRATAGPSDFVAVRLLQRGIADSASKTTDDWEDRMRHEDAWYEVLVEWWRAAHEKEMLKLHPGGIWALPAHFVGPANPLTIP